MTISKLNFETTDKNKGQSRALELVLGRKLKVL
jgi:hypothetical protein